MRIGAAKLVKEGLDKARMSRACFSGLRSFASPLPKTETEVDAFIKERIRIYMETWVYPPLEAAIAKLERKPK